MRPGFWKWGLAAHSTSYTARLHGQRIARASTDMVAEGHRVLSQDPLNAEPAPQLLASSFVTANEHVYHRNHGEFVKLDASTYKLTVASEVEEVRPTKSAFTLEEIKDRFPKQDLVTVLSCAGNRRTEMDHEKQVEGLKWGVSAIANCHFAGTRSRSVSPSQLASMLNRLIWYRRPTLRPSEGFRTRCRQAAQVGPAAHPL